MTLGAHYSLARCLENGGRRDEALAALQSVVAGRMDGPGMPPSVVLKAANLMARIYYREGELPSAIDTLSDLAMQCERWGCADDDQALKALQNMGHYALKQGELDLALAVLDHKLTLQLQKYGEAHMGTILARVTLGEILEAQGRNQEAAHQYCLANETAATHFPNDPITRQCAGLYAAFQNRWPK